MSLPLVSVVIPTYNRAATLGRAIRSALDQDYAPLEIVVVDDCSRDDTITILTEFGDSIRVLRHQNNCGASTSRNTGIDGARGEYIAFLDSDDYWRNDKTSRQMAFMREHKFAMSCTGFSSVYQQGSRPLRKKRPYGYRLSVQDIVWGIYVAPGTTLIAERRLLRAIGGYDTSLARLEDWDLLLKAALAVPDLGFLDEDLAVTTPSNAYSIATLEHSARLLVDRGLRLLAGQEPGLSRKFRAGVAFELAAAHWKKGSRMRAISYLSKTFALAPFNNQSVRVILLPWLRDVVFRAR